MKVLRTVHFLKQIRVITSKQVSSFLDNSKSQSMKPFIYFFLPNLSPIICIIWSILACFHSTKFCCGLKIVSVNLNDLLEFGIILQILQKWHFLMVLIWDDSIFFAAPSKWWTLKFVAAGCSSCGSQSKLTHLPNNHTSWMHKNWSMDQFFNQFWHILTNFW